MAKRHDLHSFGLELDEAVTARVRLRRWRHRGKRVPKWPVAAHETVEVAWAERGTMRYRVGRQELHAGPGEVVVVPAQMEHHTLIEPEMAATSVQLSPGVIAETRDIIGGGIQFGVIHDKGIVSLGELILDEVRRADRGSFLTTEALAEALSVRLLRTADAPRASVGTDPRIVRAVDVVEARFAEPLTIDELAETAGMSRYHFGRTFRRHTGKSPYQYLMATRMHRAAELLRKRRHTVTEAAYNVGVFDLGRFARAFRKEMGCAPSRYSAQNA
jgi:AraC-like DNA-binding protein/mannose-6-phosphate isomerase-like protein (cupin superfamily)